MEPTQTPADQRAASRQQTQDRLAQLEALLESALGADNGRTKDELTPLLFDGVDTAETRHATTQLLSSARRKFLKQGRMFVSFRRDGTWKTAQIATHDEGFEIASRDNSRVQSAVNGLADRVKFLWAKELLTRDEVDSIESVRRIIGTALLTPIVLPQIAAPQQP